MNSVQSDFVLNILQIKQLFFFLIKMKFVIEIGLSYKIQ